MAAQSLDLADRLQTPVFMMTDLDIGMNQRLCRPFKWDDTASTTAARCSREDLEAGKEFARYKDIDGDGIPYRTLPGTHETKGAYFTRGTSRNPQAYLEAGPDYVYNMQRLQQKFEFAKGLPKPVLTPAKVPARFGCIYYGSTSPAMHEALESLAEHDIHVNALRVRAFPFQDEIFDFVASHSKVFVVEQNRDAQLEDPPRERRRHQSREPDLGPALRRHADHRALHPQGNRPDRRRAQRAADQARQGGGSS